jgi:hypothetical protein
VKKIYLAIDFYVCLHISDTKEQMLKLLVDKEGVKRSSTTRGMFFGNRKFDKQIGDIYLHRQDNLLAVGAHELYHCAVHLKKNKPGLVWVSDKDGKKGSREELIAHMIEEGMRKLTQIVGVK